MQSAPLNLHIIDVFEMMGLLHRNFSSTSKRKSWSLPEWGPQTTGEDWNFFMPCGVEWRTVLVTFKSNIQNNEVHELGNPRHTLSMYCGRYIRITSENTQMYLSKKDWSQLMDLASACIDREVIKFSRLKDELVEWRSNCVESKSFCTPPNKMPSISIHCWMN